MTPEQHRFHNALRILMSIDRDELPTLSDSHWVKFRDNPFDYFIRASDAKKDTIWALIEKRQPAQVDQFTDGAEAMRRSVGIMLKFVYDPEIRTALETALTAIPLPTPEQS